MTTTEILLVEDNPGDVLLLTEALEQSGWDHHLTVLRDGAEAVAYLLRQGQHAKAVEPDLLLLDLNLPLMNGLEVLREIGNDARVAAIPMALLSGSDWDPAVPRAFPFPQERYFTKPMVFQGYLSLVDRLRSLLRVGRPPLPGDEVHPLEAPRGPHAQGPPHP